MEYSYTGKCTGKICDNNGKPIEGKDLGQKLTQIQLDAMIKKGYIKEVPKKTEK